MNSDVFVIRGFRRWGEAVAYCAAHNQDDDGWIYEPVMHGEEIVVIEKRKQA